LQLWTLDIMKVAGAEPIVPTTFEVSGFIDFTAPAADPLFMKTI